MLGVQQSWFTKQSQKEQPSTKSVQFKQPSKQSEALEAAWTEELRRRREGKYPRSFVQSNKESQLQLKHAREIYQRSMKPALETRREQRLGQMLAGQFLGQGDTSGRPDWEPPEY